MRAAWCSPRPNGTRSAPVADNDLQRGIDLGTQVGWKCMRDAVERAKANAERHGLVESVRTLQIILETYPENLPDQAKALDDAAAAKG